ncbi:MAG: class I SAM-dependent methyltransferase [Planctomycetes bacterium]|nr:class I SAM-dependent methyltransferase [Planctomycetota bacterium]
MEKEAMGGVLRNLDCVLDNPAQLRTPERLLIYTLVTAFKPRVALEIGSAEGGSALLTCAAMDDNGFGRMVCVDPEFRFSDAVWERVKHRVTRVQGFSPEALGEAARVVHPERFDFAFIDGDHTFEGVQRDIRGVLPLLADRALLLFHDSHHPPVRAGIDDIIEGGSGDLIDLGEMSVEQTMLTAQDGTEIWGGLRAARFVRGRTIAAGAATNEVCDENSRAAMNTLIRRGSEKIAELQKANESLWRDLQSMREGFDERGQRIAELESRFAESWAEWQAARKNYEAEIARLLAGFEERGARVRELEAHGAKLWDEMTQLSREFDLRGAHVRQLEEHALKIWDELKQLGREFDLRGERVKELDAELARVTAELNGGRKR